MSILRKFWVTSIRRQLMLGIILVHAILMSIFVFDLVNRQHEFLHEQSIGQAHSLAATLAANSISWVLANDIIGLEEVLQSQVHYPDLQYAMVLNPDGRVLGHTDNNKTGLYISDKASQVLLNSKKQQQVVVMTHKLIDVASPIYSNNEFIGWARVSLGHEKIESGLKIITRDGILYTILAIIIGALFAFFLSKSITKGLNHLVGVAENIKQGNLNVRSKLTREDEIGRLSDDFNLMLDTINEGRRNRQAIMDNTPAVVYAKDLDGRYILVNRMFTQLFGIEKEDLIGKTDFEIFPKKIAENFSNNDKAVLNSELGLELEEIAPHADGPHTYVSVKFPLKDDNNETYAVCGISTDITQRKKEEEDLRSSAQHLQLYRDQSPIATIEWNTNFEIIDWNPAAEKLFGYTLDEVKGRYFADIMLPENAVVDVEKVWKDLMAQTGGTKSINDNLTKNGNIILCEWHNTPLIDETGKVIGAASIVLDITAEHQAQQKLLHKEQEQRDILNSMIDAVITIDESGIVLTFNQAAETLFAYSADEVIGNNITLLMPEHFAKDHDQYLHQYLQTGEAHILGIGREVEAVRKDKSSFPMRLSVAELPRISEGKRRFIGSCMDLTFIKSQEEQIRRSQKMDAVGKLTGGIAHDYNNMLSVISGYSDLLVKALSENPKLSKYANEIHHAGERGAKLTKKLLAFTRKISSDTEVVKINQLILDQQHMLEKTLTVRIKLVLDLSDDVWPVKLDSGDMEDAILNMSINAMHAIESNGQLTIKTSNQKISAADALKLNVNTGDYVLLCLTDTGCGMDAKTQQQIFDPFFSTKGHQGTGLGLAQVYAFIERSNGAIKVYSEPGRGTQLNIYFPRFDESIEESVTEIVESKEHFYGKESILIVDDEPALLYLCSEFIDAEGYQVFTAENAKQALEILEKESIDLMLSDVIMPEMDGFQLAAIVQNKYPDIKIQLASGFSDDRHLKSNNDSLNKELIHKPYNSKTILKRIRELLDN